MNKFLEQIAIVIKYSDFWLSLAQLDLKNRFRRTSLGILWVAIQPFMFSLLVSVVFHYVFERDFLEFSIYVFSGVVTWSWISDSFMSGSKAVVDSAAFIRQKKLPLAIYSLRSVISVSFSFFLSFLGFLVWFFVLGNGLSISATFLPLSFLTILFLIAPIVLVSSVLGTVFRDFPQLMQISLTGLWLVSPVFIDKSAFSNDGIKVWDYINPVSNMLSLIRDPILANQAPTLVNYLITVLCGIVMWLIAVLLLKKFEKSIVFYL